MVITTIIFDLGGVVLCNDWHDFNEKKFEEFYYTLGISYADFEKRWYRLWPLFELGKLSEEVFWKRFLGSFYSGKSDIAKAKKIWRKHQKADVEMIKLAKKLKKHYQLAALANSSKEWGLFRKKKFKLTRYFEKVLISGNYGLGKPDPKIFELIIKLLKELPKNCLFIDDSTNNVLSAKKCGFNGILFTNQKELEIELKRLGIKF